MAAPPSLASRFEGLQNRPRTGPAAIVPAVTVESLADAVAAELHRASVADFEWVEKIWQRTGRFYWENEPVPGFRLVIGYGTCRHSFDDGWEGELNALIWTHIRTKPLHNDARTYAQKHGLLVDVIPEDPFGGIVHFWLDDDPLHAPTNITRKAMRIQERVLQWYKQPVRVCENLEEAVQEELNRMEVLGASDVHSEAYVGLGASAKVHRQWNYGRHMLVHTAVRTEGKKWSDVALEANELSRREGLQWRADRNDTWNHRMGVRGTIVVGKQVSGASRMSDARIVQIQQQYDEKD